MNFRSWRTPSSLALACLASFGIGQGRIAEGLAIGGMVRSGRYPVVADAIQAQLARGAWQAPVAGAQVTGPDGQPRSWAAVKAKEDGWIESSAFSGGYFVANVPASEAGIMILEAAGHSAVYVNGELHVGDPYGYGFIRTPVELKAGINELLFACSRGRVRASLVRPTSSAFLNVGDVTVPDYVEGAAPGPGALIVVNASRAPLTGARLEIDGRAFPLRPVPPLASVKTPFPMPAEPPVDGKLRISLIDSKRQALDTAMISVRTRRANEVHKRTFVSHIDGSVQYFAVNPAQKPAPENALLFSLHGASVEALGQAEAYSSKDWLTLVAPTNRRPFGFDWEDWGRWDALEVMAIAKGSILHDPIRVSLTGHSMGGHGTWHLGVTFPDQFAAIGPSAGWESFFSYAGGLTIAEPDAVDKILLRATNPSRTLRLAENLAGLGVYILHGDADDNVPVTEARRMREELGKLGIEPAWHEEKGAGHWWSREGYPGAACVDWPEMFAMFEKATIPLPVEVDQVLFRTASPSVSARSHWVIVEQQREPLEISSVDIRLDREKAAFVGKTENVETLALDITAAFGRTPKAVGVQLDGFSLTAHPNSAGFVRLRRVGAAWRTVEQLAGSQKSPLRMGPFKEAFNNNFVLVYGTAGTDAEDAWLYGKARYDAETFWYRGNGSPEVLSDRELDLRQVGRRNIILYGNRDTNRLWERLLKDSPVRAERERIFVGDRMFVGSDLVALFCRPSLGSKAMIGAVAVTGAPSWRLAERLPYFTSGVGYPDWTVMRAVGLETGLTGVVGAGFFDNDWRLGRAPAFRE